MVRGQGQRRLPLVTREVRTMTLKPWITSLATVSLFTVTGLAFAQQPTPQPTPQTSDPVVQRGTGTSMTNPVSTDGKPITTGHLPTGERGTGTSMTNPIGVDGKPLTQSTNFGTR
jgi:hypothetical protein